MATPKHWNGYQANFLTGFQIPMPTLGKWEDDVAVNNETGKPELPFIHFSSVQSISRRLPLFTASNVNRDKWVQAGREGSFRSDKRINDSEQFSTIIYKRINKEQTKPELKMAKGHMVRREDVQWDMNKNQDNAIEAAEATFYYTNASPQHQGLNNEVWKELENSILVRGRSRDPKKAIVFTGPVLAARDPWLVIHENDKNEIRCPLRFWKVVYYVNKENELRYAAFLMSHKEEVERDGYVMLERDRAVAEIPFLEFDEREKYQVNISVIEKLTGFKFKSAKEALPEGEHRKLSKAPAERTVRSISKDFSDMEEIAVVEGLVV